MNFLKRLEKRFSLYINPDPGAGLEAGTSGVGGGGVSTGGGSAAQKLKAAAAGRNRAAYRGRVLASFNFTVTTSGTPVQLPSYRVPAGGVVELRPRSNNTNAVYAGAHGITKPRLAANSPAPGAIMLRNVDSPEVIVCENLMEIWTDADTNGEGGQAFVKWGEGL